MSKKPVKYYKVVFREATKLVSLMDIPGTIEYKVGEFVKPKDGNGPLAVVTDCNDAVTFSNRSIYNDVYQCKIVKSRAKSLWYRHPDGGKVEVSLRNVQNTVAQSTVLATQVMLIKKIW